jgi:predicted 3-demethylubiquinone-9 3-methyltransferase (glyoxalase superfamily)
MERRDAPREESEMQKITPMLWFDNNAEEAVNLYVSTFKNSKINSVSRYGDAGPGPKGSVMTVSFQLEGQNFTALNAGPHFKFNEAISFVVDCQTQEEVDAFWEKLTSNGGKESQCGWLKDRFGLSWQITPRILIELIQDKDPCEIAAGDAGYAADEEDRHPGLEGRLRRQGLSSIEFCVRRGLECTKNVRGSTASPADFTRQIGGSGIARGIHRDSRMHLQDGFIVGIFNYCDRWCDTCPFTPRCRVFADMAEGGAARDPRAVALEGPRWMRELVDGINAGRSWRPACRRAPSIPANDRRRAPADSRTRLTPTAKRCTDGYAPPASMRYATCQIHAPSCRWLHTIIPPKIVRALRGLAHRFPEDPDWPADHGGFRQGGARLHRPFAYRVFRDEGSGDGVGCGDPAVHRPSRLARPGARTRCSRTRVRLSDPRSTSRRTLRGFQASLQ